MNTKILKRLVLLSMVLCCVVENAFAGGGTTYYYAKVTAHVATTGAGTVYVNPDGGNTDDFAGYREDLSDGGNATATSGGSVNVSMFAKPNVGYEFVGWSTSGSATTYENTSAHYTKSVTAATRGGVDNPRTYDMYAYFQELPKFFCSANAVSTRTGETANVDYNVIAYGEHANSTAGSTIATFTATTNTGYAFDGWSETETGTIVSADNPYFVTLTSATTTQADAVTKTLYARYSSTKCLPPTITSQETSSGYTITLNHVLSDVTIKYTTDGTTPTTSNGTQYVSSFSVSNGTTVKAIAIKGTVVSEVSSKSFFNTQVNNANAIVYINDAEDHTWTYYAGVDESVDGGNYNTNYLGKMYSPDPRNVKITYQANGGAVSISESETTFVYYKTIEKVDGTYKYQVISNPFSKRPVVNSKVQGFAGWKLKSITTGASITGHTTTTNSTLALDEELTLTLPDAGVNGTSAEIVFEATWVDATIVRNTTSGLSSSGTYETNIIVLSQDYSTAISPSYPCTIMMVEPDGNADYRNYTFSGSITPADLHTTGQTTKIEFAKWSIPNSGTSWNPSYTIDAQGRNFTIGRGMTINNSSVLYGSNSNVVMNQVLKVESGTFSNYRGCANLSSHTKQIVVFGNDYDRAKNDNDKLSITGNIYGLTTSANLGLTDISKELFHITTKSGKFYPNPTLNDATYQNAFYLFDYSANNNGTRTLVIEGGEFGHIAGGANSTSGDNNVVNLKIRMKGGVVNGSIFGGAAQYNVSGSKQFVFTGGTIKGWIAGGSNGSASGDQGSVTGYSYVYIGGNTQVNSNGNTNTLNAGVGGTVYAAGCGQSATATSGRVALGTNVVVADNAYVERGVYGGGSFGYCPTDKTSNIYITGGEVGGASGATNFAGMTGSSWNQSPNYSYSGDITGGVYGGACQNSGGAVNIYMTGGLVNGGLYGGSNVSGTINQNVKMVVTGGQVGTPTNPANIHGGGYGNSTRVLGSVNLTVGESGSTEGATIYGDVYGGSAEGKTNGNTSRTASAVTNVTLNAGTINGSLYGGGLGTGSYAADVYGPVQVTVNGGSVKKTTADGSGGVYGCNNINGAPKNVVFVDIYGTDPAPAENQYALFSVYGGGNKADYDNQPVINIHNCDNSIEYVYGGGNAANVASTSVTIYGGNKIGNVFGGGNGQNGEANVTDGDTYVMIYGGTIGNVYGGSNAAGTIAGDLEVLISPLNNDVGEDVVFCPLDIDNVYGGGNHADSKAGALDIFCGYLSNTFHIGSVYGGANQADITSGNIELNITAGNIDNVFGGNNTSGNISGSITVTVDDEGSGCGMEVGNVYGGGNKAAYTGSPTVNINNGHLTGSVFGGGLGSTAVVTGNPQVTIGSTISTDVVTIDGNVFGGGDAANVNGSPAVVVNNSNTLIGTKTDGEWNTTGGTVYGGGNAAHVTGSSNSTSVIINCGDIRRVFGGGNGEVSAANVAGNATTTIHGGTIHQAFAGSNAAGTISGTAKITVDNDNTYSSCTETIDEVYGGGNLAAGNAGTVEIKCGAIVGDVYGGANAADVTSAITLDITGGTLGRVFGGNNTSGNVTGKITVNINKADDCSTFSVGTVYGAGNQASYTPTTVGAYPEVNILKGTVTNDVFGGGLGASATVTSSPVVNINGGNVGGAVYGGGSLASVTGSTTVNLKNASSTVTGNIYGGGLGCNNCGESGAAVAANISGSTAVNISNGAVSSVFGCNNIYGAPSTGASVTVTGGTMSANVYGGGNLAAASVSPVVTINGGTMDKVYGGGLGSTAVITGSPVVTINKTETDMTVVDVFGGGDAAAVQAPASGTSVCTVNMQAGTVDHIYGGGNQAGVSTTDVNVSGGAITDGLYGGCNTSGTVTGTIAVDVTGGTIGTSSDPANVHGGGYGNATATGGNVAVTINGSDVTINGDVYGGSALGSVNDASNETTTVTLTSGTINGDLYGGGLGDATNAADVTGSTVVIINGGTVNNVFGCNNANGDPAGASVTVNGGTINNNVYGGGNLAAASVNPVVTINNGTLPGSVFGGGKGDPSDNTHEIAMVTGNPQVIIGDDNGSHSVSIAGNVFGGGDAANVKGATTVTVNKCNTLIGAKTDGVWSTTAGTVYGGGNAADVVKNGTTGGSTSVVVNGGDIYRVFGGGNGEGTDNPGANVANGTNVAIHAGNIHQAFAGSNAKGNITGTSVVTIDHDISTCNELVDEVYGGGNLAAGNAGTITVECGAVIGDLYGGANQADIGTSTDPCDITLNVTGGSINRVFGGNNTSGNVTGKITVKINKADDCSTFSVGTVYGAGNQASYTPTTAGAYPEVNILKGTVTNDVFGGGLGASATVTSSPIVNINGGNVGGDVYGGGSLASVTGSTTVNLKNANSTVTGNIYGGGLGRVADVEHSIAAVAANVSGTTTVTISDGEVSNIFGCNNINGAPATGATVTVNGGTISNNIYGGGNLAAASVSPVVTINNGTLPGSVFGGGKGDPDDELHAIATITGSPTVTIGDNNSSHTVIIKGNVFGGGDAANVVGVPNVTVNDCNTLIGEKNSSGEWSTSAGTVYGGCNAAHVTGSTSDIDNGTNVSITGGQIYRVFAGGNGVVSPANIAGNPTLAISGGEIAEIYGGSNSQGTIGGVPQITIAKVQNANCPLAIENLYGGGNEAPSTGVDLVVEGCDSITNVYGGANKADITGNITLTIKSGKIGNVFGGNNNGGNITGSIIVNIYWDGSDCWNVDNVYGAGNLATYTAPTASSYGDKAGKFPEVNIKNGKVNYNVFGAGKGDGSKVGSTEVYKGQVTGNPQVKLIGGSCKNIYGGGDAAPVNGNTNVTINATDRPANEGEYHVEECVFGGGLGATAVINGSTSITITGSSAIHGNVYGGGNAGLVTGDTHIDIK